MSQCSRQALPDEVLPLIFTANAAHKVAALIAEEGDPNLKLRIYIQGGGCAGFQYGFTLDDQIETQDQIYTTEGVALLIDQQSARYLSGAKIDYVEDLQGYYKHLQMGLPALYYNWRENPKDLAPWIEYLLRTMALDYEKVAKKSVKLQTLCLLQQTVYQLTLVSY